MTDRYMVYWYNKPAKDNNEPIQVMFSGGIYNHPEQKNEEDLIKTLYAQYGVNLVDHLRGSFGVCIYDTIKQQMIVVRDRMGEVPLYYAEIPCGVVVSSELKTILNEYIDQPQLNMEPLLAPIRFTGGISPRDTWIEQIKRVLPGEMLIIDAHGVRHHRYWERKRTYDYNGSFEQAKEDTLQLMHEAVDLEMRSDKPVAVMLSGGVDSSAVAALAKRAGRDVHTITTGYSGHHAQDERDVAKRFSAEQGLIYHEIELSENDYIDSFEEMSSILDEPMTDSTAIAQWAMFKKVKEMGFEVLLGGMGGDELFYGYPAWNQLGESLKLRREHEALFPWKGKKMDWLRFMSKHLQWVLYAGYPSKLEDKSYGWWMHDDYYRFLKNATLTLNGETISLEDFRYKIQKGFPLCEAGKEVDIIYDDCIDTVMTQAFLYISYRLSNACAIESRSPLLDYKLVEHVMSLPLEYKYISGKPKQFMKDVLSGIVPDYILYADKRGFTSPPSFVTHVAQHHPYKMFKSDYPFYNALLADQVLQKLWKK